MLSHQVLVKEGTPHGWQAWSETVWTILKASSGRSVHGAVLIWVAYSKFFFIQLDIALI